MSERTVCAACPYHAEGICTVKEQRQGGYARCDCTVGQVAEFVLRACETTGVPLDEVVRYRDIMAATLARGPELESRTCADCDNFEPGRMLGNQPRDCWNFRHATADQPACPTFAPRLESRTCSTCHSWCQQPAPASGFCGVHGHSVPLTTPCGLWSPR